MITVRRCRFYFSVFLTIFAFGFAGPVRAEIPYWKVEEIKIGAVGYGLTVFQGHKPEKFYFKINGFEDASEGVNLLISVWKEANGKKKPFSVASGMSGSPLYIDGKLAAAIAYKWGRNVSEEGIARPFQYIYEEGIRASRFRLLHNGVIRKPYNLDKDKMLKPGSSIKIGFVTGDPDFSEYVMGTVTTVDQSTNTLYALGHNVRSLSRQTAEGPVSYTAWEGEVADTLNSIGIKVPARDKVKGQYARIWFSGTHGIYGAIDEVAEMIPLTLESKISGHNKSVKVEIPYGTASLGVIQIVTGRFLDTYLEPLGEITVDIQGRISTEKNSILITERFSHPIRDLDAFSKIFLKRTSFFGSFSQILSADNRSKFSELHLLFEVQPLGPTFAINRADILETTVVGSGNKLRVAIQIVEEGRLTTSVRRFEPILEIDIPADTVTGSGTVIVETGETYVDRKQTALPPPANLEQLMQNIALNAGSNDSFYVTVLLPPEDKNKTNTVAKEGMPTLWLESKHDKTIFRNFYKVLQPIRVKIPVPGSVITSRKERFELSFQVQAKRFGSKLGIAINVLSGIFLFIVALIAFVFASFVAAKLNPSIDRLYKSAKKFVIRK